MNLGTGYRNIRIPGGRLLKVTPVYDAYWRFAAERQMIFMRRVFGSLPPWTTDSVLVSHRFTNPYRASDRVSQYVIRHVLYTGPQNAEEIFFRAILFKIFNRIDTWRRLKAAVGLPSWHNFDFERYASVLDKSFANGERIYSGAYIMPSPSFGNARKHRNHLRLLEYMMRDGAPRRVAEAHSLRDIYETLRGYSSLGDFLAFQFTIDLNYSVLTDCSETEFVVAGPGARNGIQKCFVDTANLNNADIIRMMAERADFEFERLGLDFRNLWGRQLQLIDCQNLFCEVDKYARAAHPEIKGESARTRIKQRFAPNSESLPQWYPPKWDLQIPVFSLSTDPETQDHAQQQTLSFNALAV